MHIIFIDSIEFIDQFGETLHLKLALRFRRFPNILEAVRPNLFYSMSRIEFESAISDLDSRIPQSENTAEFEFLLPDGTEAIEACLIY